jgi:hypothetical protein
MARRFVTDSKAAILVVLNRHAVDYVVIGGYAAEVHGWDGVTDDVDVTPRTDADNLERLATALTELEAKARVEGYPDGFELPGGIDVRTLKDAISLAFVTKHGNLDLAFLPDGTEGFKDLDKGAVSHRIETLTVRVADLRDVIRSKEAAARAKDLATLPALRELLERTD